MARTHTTLDLDRELLHDAAEALGTTRTTEPGRSRAGAVEPRPGVPWQLIVVSASRVSRGIRDETLGQPRLTLT